MHDYNIYFQMKASVTAFLVTMIKFDCYIFSSREKYMLYMNRKMYTRCIYFWNLCKAKYEVVFQLKFSILLPYFCSESFNANRNKISNDIIKFSIMFIIGLTINHFHPILSNLKDKISSEIVITFLKVE